MSDNHLIFSKKVYSLVGKIPKGKVATYGQIAKMAGDSCAAQEVGRILNRVSPEQNLPCHRVVNQKGELAPNFVFGGQIKQRNLLESEGITFDLKGNINLQFHLWGEHEQLRLF